MAKKTAPWLHLVVLSIIFLSIGYALFVQSRSSEEAGEALLQDLPPPESEPLYPHILQANASLYSVLREMGVTSQEIHKMVEAAKPIVDLGRLRAGTQFRTIRSAANADQIVGLEFRFSPVEKLNLSFTEGIWKAEIQKENVETRVVNYMGSVKSTLWESAEEADMDPDLIVQLSEIFAWQVDFSREVRVRDRWRLTVEQKLVRGRPIGWGSILAAEYENAGELHTALLYQDGESSGYYGLDGSNLRRMFLKSPIKFGRISSRFNRKRFHPVLKIRRPHLGVDYAAARGTPIRSVGDGTVLLAGWKGGGGRTVKIRHNSTYQTSYLHMSGFAKGIKRGTRVKQGQIIGYVGATGLATGPHLHFEFSVNGKVVDPLKAKFPTADPIPKTKIASFKAQISGLLATLPGWDGLELAGRKPGASDSAVERSEDAGVSVTGESIN